MGTTMSPNECLYLNLKLLGFEQYMSKNINITRHVVFNGSMFDTKNPPAFQCVTHFILGACGRAFGADVILTRMKPCYPCLERNQEKDFRQLTVEFFINVEKDKDFVANTRIPFQNIVGEPGGSKFVHLYLKLTNLIMIRKMETEQRSMVRSITASTPQLNIVGFVKENIDSMNQFKQTLSDSKENSFQAGQMVLQPFEESKNSSIEWQDAVSNTCANLLRSHGCPDVKPIAVNVKLRMAEQSDQVKKQIDKIRKLNSDLTVVSKSLMTHGSKLLDVDFGNCRVSEPVPLLRKAIEVQKFFEEQLLHIQPKVIEDNENRSSKLIDQFGKSQLELESLKIKLKSASSDEKLETLRRKVLEIPELREKYERERKQLIPSRDPVVVFGAVRSKKLPRGWWMSEAAALSEPFNKFNSQEEKINSNGFNNNSTVPNHRDSIMSDDMSFNFDLTTASPRISGITDQSSIALVDLE